VRPVPIPDDLVPAGCKRFIISAPDGDLTSDQIRPVEAVAGVVDGQVLMSMLLAMEPGDLDRLRAMETELGVAGVWLTMMTNQIPAFSVDIADAGA
jgi:hypothetical protein